ncbi:putative O-methyltransferase YrrM [Dyadobacter jejuensis]|uniref:Putative O-methyltransferase YrrM n=1 Tax=Dyadobacter jejuensis TaxID=1082580 RepID=A0A316AA30_9BACT|nr:O-methyltransferase [Dyadobacter jejuensis]PWJ54523.1 putative O-methyltransferase YrrM [Dyadobacter jejuensis]
MKFILNEIESYCELHSDPESDLLSKLNRNTQANVLNPRMLSGPLQGRLLSLFSGMINPKRILEIGTYTGYSALCLAEGLSDDGKLITLDINEELETMARSYFDDSPYSQKIDYRIGNALDLIPEIDEVFDLVFIDADKINYQAYYDLCLPKMRPGGYILADNVLWSGKVVEKLNKIDKDTQALLDFNKAITDDKRVSNLLLPIRDGLMVIQKHA